jgi:hypothetical protein
LLFEVLRYQPKGFKQRRPDGRGGWTWNVSGVRRVLYRLPAVLQAVADGRRVWVVEGERDADALAELGLCATCNSGGAGKWKPEYGEVLRGARVAVIPDADEPGRKHAQQVAAALHGIATSIRIVELPAGKDVSDWLADHGGTRAELLTLVKAAPEWQPTADAAENPPETETTRSGPYFVRANRTYHEKLTKDGPVPELLSNFAARIVQDVVYDDGAEQSRRLALEGTLSDGRPLPRVEVPAGDFAGMTTIVPSWGTIAVKSAGWGATDHLRCAIQLLSGDVPRRTVFTHLGWRKVENEWVYLHAAGAVGSTGPVATVEVDPPAPLAGYVLPDPGDEHLAATVRASLRVLDLGPNRLTVPVLAAVYRAVMGGSDFGLHLAGPTGVFKTELAALAQQHFGAGLDARHLPGSWASTGNSLEALGFAAKDALLVVDDFAPGGSTHDVQRYHKEADRLLRAQGNTAGRGRMRPDGTLRPPKPPRGLVLSTGEDVPRGQSLRSRLLVLEVSPGDVDAERLTLCQRDAAAGLYAQALAAFLRWLAPRYETTRAALKDKVAELREEFQQADQHARTPGIVADLGIGLWTFLRFAKSVGVIDREEQTALWERAAAALTEAALAQAIHQADAEPEFRPLPCRGGRCGRSKGAGESVLRMAGRRAPGPPDRLGGG